MARLNEWIQLTGTTFRNLSGQSVSRLYDVEWPTARRRLLEEHRQSIEQDTRRMRRWTRTSSALLYGLAKRLTPERRALFLIAHVVGVVSLLYLMFGGTANEVKVAACLALAFLSVTFLLSLELIDKLTFRDELELARELQASLRPAEMPKVTGWDLSAMTQSANTVGGDLYDFAVLPDSRLAILFGDASGHGMTAGLVMAVAQAGFRTQLEIDPRPDAIMGSLNRLLCRTGGAQSFFACCYVLLEPNGRYLAAVAGHPPILHLSPAGEITQRIGSGSYPLGIRQSLCWPAAEGQLCEGEALLFYSDGLPEAHDRSDDAFGYERFERTAVASSGLTAAEKLQTILAEWRRFIGDRAIDDDISLAMVRRSSLAAQ